MFVILCLSISHHTVCRTYWFLSAQLGVRVGNGRGQALVRPEQSKLRYGLKTMSTCTLIFCISFLYATFSIVFAGFMDSTAHMGRDKNDLSMNSGNNSFLDSTKNFKCLAPDEPWLTSEVTRRFLIIAHQVFVRIGLIVLAQWSLLLTMNPATRVRVLSGCQYAIRLDLCTG